MSEGPAAIGEHPEGQAEPTGHPPLPPRLTLEERLLLENLALKVENLRLQQERMRQDFVSSTKMLIDLRKEANEHEMGLNKKYGVTLAHCNLQPDGLIVPKAPEQAPLNGGSR